MIEPHYYLSFPTDGTIRPAAAGRTVFIYLDPRGGNVAGAYATGAVQDYGVSSGQFSNIGIPPGMMGKIRTVLLFADGDISVGILPGVGRLYIPPGSWIPIPATGVNTLSLESPYPYNWAIILTTAEMPITPAVLGISQERWSNDTLTKSADAGVADSFAAVNFAARYGTSEIDPTVAANSAALLSTRSVGQKMVVCYNAGGSYSPDINVRVRQMYTPTGTEGITIPPEPSINPFTIAYGDHAIAENNIGAPFLEVEGRVDAAAVPGATARLRVYYYGQIGAFR